LTLPGCTSGSHSSEQVARLAPVATTVGATTGAAATSVEDGVETYGTAVAEKPAAPKEVQPVVAVEEKKPEPLEQDDLSIPVEQGTKCKRRGCNAEYVSDEISRGDGYDAKCVFHPG